MIYLQFWLLIAVASKLTIGGFLYDNMESLAGIEQAVSLILRGERELRLPPRYRNMVLFIGRAAAGKTTTAQLLAADIRLLNAYFIVNEKPSTTTEKETCNPDVSELPNCPDGTEGEALESGLEIRDWTGFIHYGAARPPHVHPLLFLHNPNKASQCYGSPAARISLPKYVAYNDMPRTNDPGNMSVDFAATYFTHYVLRHVRQVKILLIIDYEQLYYLFDNYGSNKKLFPSIFIEYFSGELDFFQEDYEKIMNEDHTYVVYTKIPKWYGLDNKLQDDTSMYNKMDGLLTPMMKEFERLTGFDHISQNQIKMHIKALTMLKLMMNPDKRILLRRPMMSGPIEADKALLEKARQLRQIVTNNLKWYKRPVEGNDFFTALHFSTFTGLPKLEKMLNDAAIHIMHKFNDMFIEHYRSLIVVKKEVKRTMPGDTTKNGLQALSQYMSKHLAVFFVQIHQVLEMKRPIPEVLYNCMLFLFWRLHLGKPPVSEFLDYMILTRTYWFIYNQKKKSADEKADGNWTVDASNWLNALDDSVKYAMSLDCWLQMMNALHQKLKMYNIQSQRFRYRVNKPEDWGKGFPKQNDRFIINKENVRQLIIVLQLYQLPQFKCYKDVKFIDNVMMIWLEHVFNATLYERVNVTCGKTIRIAGDFLMMSKAVKSLLRCKQLVRNVEAVELFAGDTIFIDADLILIGWTVKVTMLAPKWEVVGLGSYRKINLNGAPGGYRHTRNRPAGRSGRAGKPGGAAGCFVGLANEILYSEALVFTAQGGRGGPGESGTEGSNAKHYYQQEGWWDLHGVPLVDCPKGREACMEYIGRQQLEAWRSNEYSHDFTTQLSQMGNEGMDSAGHAGAGGMPGLGGPGGTVKIYSLLKNAENITVNHELSGANGDCGLGAEGGVGGQMEDDFMIMWVPKPVSKMVVWYQGANTYASLSGADRPACISPLDQETYVRTIRCDSASRAIQQYKNWALPWTKFPVRKTELIKYLDELDTAKIISADSTVTELLRKWYTLGQTSGDKYQILGEQRRFIKRVKERSKVKTSNADKAILTRLHLAGLSRLCYLLVEATPNIEMNVSKCITVTRPAIKTIMTGDIAYAAGSSFHRLGDHIKGSLTKRIQVLLSFASEALKKVNNNERGTIITCNKIIGKIFGIAKNLLSLIRGEISDFEKLNHYIMKLKKYAAQLTVEWKLERVIGSLEKWTINNGWEKEEPLDEVGDWSAAFLGDVVHHIRFVGNSMAAKYEKTMGPSYIVGEGLANAASELAIVMLQMERLQQLHYLETHGNTLNSKQKFGEDANLIIKQLDTDIQRYLLLELEANVRSAFVHFMFPWAETYLLLLAPMPAEITSTHPLNRLVDKMYSNFKYIRHELEDENKHTNKSKDRERRTSRIWRHGLFSESGGCQSSRPFFIWEERLHYLTISELLEGQTVLLIADGEAAPPPARTALDCIREPRAVLRLVPQPFDSEYVKTLIRILQKTKIKMTRLSSGSWRCGNAGWWRSAYHSPYAVFSARLVQTPDIYPKYVKQMKGHVYITLEGRARWADDPGDVCQSKQLERRYQRDKLTTPLANLIWPFHQMIYPLLSAYDVVSMYSDFDKQPNH